MVRKGLKISELAEMTGVPKSTILYYVKKGLIPEPVKTSPNMAWYSEECIEKINFIKEMQTKRFVPLDHIKHMMEAVDEKHLPPEMLLQLNKLIFEDKTEDDPSYNKAEFLKIVELTEQELAELEELKLVIPTIDEDERTYAAEDIQTVSNLKKMFEFGITPNDLSYYPRLVADIIKKDLELHQEKIEPLGGQNTPLFIETTEMMLSMARYAREYYFRKLFPQSIVKMIKEKPHRCLEEREDEE